MRYELFIRHPSAPAHYRKRTSKPKANKVGLEREQQHPHTDTSATQTPGDSTAPAFPACACQHFHTPGSHTCPRNSMSKSKCLTPVQFSLVINGRVVTAPQNLWDVPPAGADGPEHAHLNTGGAKPLAPPVWLQPTSISVS